MRWPLVNKHKSGPSNHRLVGRGFSSSRVASFATAKLCRHWMWLGVFLGVLFGAPLSSTPGSQHPAVRGQSPVNFGPENHLKPSKRGSKWARSALKPSPNCPQFALYTRQYEVVDGSPLSR